MSAYPQRMSRTPGPIRRAGSRAWQATRSFFARLRRAPIAAARSMRAFVISVTSLATGASSYLGSLVGRSIYGRAYAESAWVYVCASLNSEAASKATWKIERRIDGEWIAVDRAMDDLESLQDLLDAPHPWLTWQDLVERAMLDLQLAGNALSRMVKGETRDTRDKTIELWPIWQTQSVTVKRDATMLMPDRYQYVEWNGHPKEIDAEDVIHAQLPNPDDIFWGQGRLAAAASAINVDSASASAQSTSLQNAFNPVGVLSIDAPEGLTGDDQTDAEEDFATRYQGDANAGKLVVVNGARARFERMGLTPSEMSYLETRKATRDEIANIFGTPLPILGALEYATLNNARTLLEHWWLNTLVPLLKRYERAVNLQMVRPQWGRDVRVCVDISQVPELIPGLKERTEVGLDLQSLGYSSDDINRRLGLGMPMDRL